MGLPRASALWRFAGLLGVLAAPAQAATFSTIASIPGGPQIGAVANGMLYGTLPYSGAGVLFRLSVTGTGYTVLHDFTAARDGSAPDARLAINASGTLFGTTPGGGAYGGGTAWDYTAAGKFVVTHNFGNGGDGAAPMQGPVLLGGALYNATGEGAIGGSGNIYRLSPGGTYSVLYEFQSMGDGHCPFSGVASGPGGTLFGTTVGVGFGGNPNGSVWRFTPATGIHTLYVFQNGADGEWPHQAPVADGQGNLFGSSAIQNGAAYAGALWEIPAGGSFTILHAMNAATDGFAPNSPLLLNRDGLLYGTTSSGGAAGYGTVFSLSRKGVFTVIHSFTAGADGAQPTGNLVRDATGSIYGGTAYGPVFKITP